MTNFERAHNRWLDPPDEPTHWECDRCGQVFDGGDLNHNERGYEWICDDCIEELGEEFNSKPGQGRLL